MRCRESYGAGCPLCYSGLKGKAVYRGHAGFRRVSRPVVEDSAMALVKPAASGSKPGVPAAALCADGMVEVGPAIQEWLTGTAYEDGKPRQTATIMLLAEAGRWKAWVHDRDSRRSAWLSSEGLGDLFVALERALASGVADWRADRK